jgi:transposase
MHLGGTVVMPLPVGSRATSQRVSASTGMIGSIARNRRKGLSDYLNEQLEYFVGLDWGSENHRIVLLNHEGRVIDQYDAAHSGRGLEALVDRLRRTCRCLPGDVGIAIEVSWGAVVETLTEAGFSVFSINPKQVDRFRDRYTVAGAKDDSRDALVLAGALRTDRKSFKRVQADNPEIIRLRELSRLDEELKNELRRATNQLWEQLHRYFPQILKLSSGADDLFAWDLLDKAPTPVKAAKLTPKRISQILARHRISRFTTEQVVAILRESSLQLAPGAREAASEHILFLLPRIILLDQQIRDVEGRIARLLKELPVNANDNAKPRDVDLLLSLPGLGPTIASTILSEASRPIRERDRDALRCYAGTAPVTKQSAKRRVVNMRHACSARLRQVVFYWSGRSIMFDPQSRQHYDRLRAAGHAHARALRGVADRLVAMLVAILKSGIPYDARRRTISESKGLSAMT